MLRFPCLVLDHDDTVVQTEKTLGYPFFKEILRRFRPGIELSYEEYVLGCHELPFADMCRAKWQFSEAELQEEYLGWKQYIRTHIPSTYDGIGQIIRRQKVEGGLVCVVSLSGEENITRDYEVHFGMKPDAIYGWDLPRDHQKPSPFPLNDIMSRFHLRPEELLVVDDLKLAWRMARPLGVPIAFAAWSKTDFPELAEEMRGLCDFTFQTTESLEKFLFE